MVAAGEAATRPYKETSDVFPPKFRPITLRRIDDVIQNCSDDVISVRTSLPICHEVLSSCQQVVRLSDSAPLRLRDCAPAPWSL